VLTHGSTLHGQQFLHPGLRQEPLTYYSRSGPVGQIMQLVDQAKQPKKVGLIGLGAGASASYGRQGDTLVCYEIDNAVVRIARDPKFFTYLSDCVARGCQVETVLGDARLRLREAMDHTYDVLIVDAFSSDAVPIHLITRQAFELYMQKLAAGGYLLIHVSNRYLNLDPVVGNIAHDLGLAAFSQHDDVVDLPGKMPSDWIVVVKTPDLLKGASVNRWRQIEPNAGVGVWTDDYSNLLRVFRPK
jgi:spermidine synthase